MAIISQRITANFNPIVKKAPKGFMFKVWDIHATITSSTADIVVIVPYYVEPNADVPLEFLASFDTSIRGQAFDFAFSNGEIMKYLTITRRTGANPNIDIVIHYELIKASRIELLMEWFRRGR